MEAARLSCHPRESFIFQVTLTLSIAFSDIIEHFNPSVLMPTCAPGKGTAAHTTTE